MAKIDKPFSTYFQKSRIFMYPLIGIRQGVSVTPIQTYVAWQGKVEPNQGFLVALYHLREDQEFKVFDRDILRKNKLFHSFTEVEDGKGVYVFDMNGIRADWDNFLIGKYSKLSPDTKRKLINFFGKNQTDYAYIHSWLYPSRYFALYSELLLVKEKVLSEVGELCSIPDVNKEVLMASVKSLDVPSIIP